MLRIMESDPRMPNFIRRHPLNGEIVIVDVERVLAHPRFGKALERTIGGLGGAARAGLLRGRLRRQARGLGGARRASRTCSTSGSRTARRACGPHRCSRRSTGPTRAKGFRIVGLNADRVLELPYGDEERRAYARQQGLAFTLAHLTPEVQEAYGSVSVFPTMFFVDAKGTIVKHFVNQQEPATLEAAVRLALE